MGSKSAPSSIRPSPYLQSHATPSPQVSPLSTNFPDPPADASPQSPGRFTHDEEEKTRDPEVKWQEGAPEIHCTYTFYVSSLSEAKKTAVELAKNADLLCKEMKSSSGDHVREGYAIEFAPAEVGKFDGEWRLLLRYDPIRWFDHKLASLEINKKLEVANDYIEKVRRDGEPQETLQSVDIKEMPKAYCNYGFECKGKDTYCQFAHSEWFCRGDNPANKISSRLRCGQFAIDDLRISDFESLRLASNDETEYIVQARVEATQEVLVLPREHRTNRDMVKDPSFWMFILSDIRQLISKMAKVRGFPFSQISLNFGKWETRTSKDTRALDCHAHAHVYFKNDAFEKCEGVWERLQGRREQAENYRMKDVTRLEIERVTPLQVKGLTRRVDGLATEFNSLKTDVSEMHELLKMVAANVLQLQEQQQQQRRRPSPKQIPTSQDDPQEKKNKNKKKQGKNTGQS